MYAISLETKHAIQDKQRIFGVIQDSLELSRWMFHLWLESTCSLNINHHGISMMDPSCVKIEAERHFNLVIAVLSNFVNPRC